MAGNANSGGRNAVSPQMHIVRGTHRQDRHGSHETPEPPRGTPEPMVALEGLALEEWERMVDRLAQTGALSKVDDASIFQYARLFAETEDLARQKEEAAASVDILEENIGGLKGPDLVAAFQEISKMRRLVANYSAQVRSGRMAIRQYLVEFGMTPAARTRVKLPPSKPKSKAQAFREAKQGA